MNNKLYIILGLFIGVMLFYVFNKQPVIIIQKPTITNLKSTKYIDENNKCYKYLIKKLD